MEETAVRMVAVDLVIPSADNPRSKVGDVSELAASIQSVGIIEPLIVRDNGEGGFILLAGERRLSAAKSISLSEVPVIVRELDDAKAYEIALIDNLHREDLRPIEEAEAYRRLMKEFGHSQRSLAKLVGHSQPHISRRLSLLDLPEKLRAELDSGGITLPDAVELAKLAKMPERLESARKRAGMYGTISAAVARELQEHDSELKAKKLKKQLVAEGVTLVEWPDRGGWWNQDVKPLTHLAWVDAEAHAAEPCHAGSVSPQAEVVWVCTTPDNHPQPQPDGERADGPQGGPAYVGAGSRYADPASIDDPDERARIGALRRQEEEDRQRAEDHRQALAKAQEARGVHMRELLTRRLPKPEVTEHLALTFVAHGQGIEWEDYSQACELLGVDEDGLGATNPAEALIAYAEQGGAEAAARVGLALTFAMAESLLASWHATWSDGRYHLAFLERHGYAISDAEREELAASLGDDDGERADEAIGDGPEVADEVTDEAEGDPGTEDDASEAEAVEPQS